MNNRGFTLLELIVVLIVMAALVGIALPQYTGFVEKAKAAEAINALGAIKTAEEAARLGSATSVYTSNMNDLGIILSPTQWTYTVSANGGTSFTATANRVGGSSSGTTVTMTYTNAGATTWGGTHPGRPA